MDGSEASPNPQPLEGKEALDSPELAKTLKPATTSDQEVEPQTAEPQDENASAVPPAGGAPPSPRRPLRLRLEHLWHGLPRAGKATAVLVVFSTVLLIAYSIAAVSFKAYDEEAHVATVIIIMALFTLYATCDAIIYENTLQLVSSIILTILMLARVLWFIATRPADSNLLPLKIIWGALIALVQVTFIVAALISCREFGWRLYSKVGVDYRQKGAAGLQHLALIANGFNALVKLDFAFLVTVTALGIDVSVEHQEVPDAAVLGTSIAIFVVGVAVAALGVVVASSPKWQGRLWVFDLTAPLSFAGPIALIVQYSNNGQDVANAATSIVIGCTVFMLGRLGLWVLLHAVVKNAKKITFVAGRVTLRMATTAELPGSAHPADALLAPLKEGAWLGKPAPRNPRKLRFFQLSHDGSTLRWGWHKFVRLYYVHDVVYAAPALTITLTFLLDPELTLKCPDKKTFLAWQRGLDHLLLLLLAPDATIPGLEAKRQQNLDDAAAMEEGVLGKLGTSVRRLGKMAFRTASSEMEDRPSRAVSGELPDLAERPTSSGQLQKRLRMAAFLHESGAVVPRRQAGWSPGTWLARPRRASFTRDQENAAPGGMPERTSSGSVRWDMFRRRSEGKSMDLRPRVLLVSVGTQTDPEDYEQMSKDAETPTPVGNDADASVAEQYISMFAGAAAAGPSGANGGLHPGSVPPWAMGGTGGGSQFGFGGSPAAAGNGGPSQLAIPASPATPATLSAFGSPNGPTLSPNSPSLLAITVDVIEYDDLQLGRLLGSGSEGAVYAAWYLETPVAVKRFNRVEDSLHEVGMYLGVGSHDNVVALRALCQHEAAMYAVLEYCPRGTLDAILHHSAPQQWDPARLLPLVRSIARGMHHLHSRGIVHRDLKPANIFVGHGLTMKVGDFGMARMVGTQTSTSAGPSSAAQGLAKLSPGVLGTVQYAAPELINESLRPDVDDEAEWAMKLDVWSFGVTLWEIMERKRPFEGMQEVGVQAMWLNTPYQARLPPVKVPETLEPSAARVLRGLSDLVEDCTRLDPLARPSFGEVLQRLRGLGRSVSGVAAM